MSPLITVATLSLRDLARRRLSLGLLLLTGLLAGLYALAVDASFGGGTLLNVSHLAGADNDDLIGTTLLSLATFAALFLGGVIGVFVTLGAVRGDAERGLLQPLVVRPLGRSSYLLGRLLAAGAVAAAYSLLTFAGAVLILGFVGGWWPGGILPAALQLALAVVTLTALSLLGSVFLAPAANGIILFVVFGIGLLAGLLGQVGSTIGSERLEQIGEVGAWALPFEGAYQRALHSIAEAADAPHLLVDVGPFAGGAVPGPGILIWAAVFALLTTAIAIAAFARADL